MSHIFISYASEDRQRAETLAAALDRHGWPVWSDREIPPGKTFDQVIEEALDAAKCVIVLWSKQSVTSNWVKSEASEGLRRGILVPALIDDVRIPLEFSRIQAARLVDWNGESAHPEFEKLVRAVQPVLGQPVRPEAEQAALLETPEDAVTVVEPEKDPAPARVPSPPPAELPVKTPRSERTASIFDGLSVRKVLFLFIGVAFLAATFWIFRGPDRAIQVVPGLHSPPRSAFPEKKPQGLAPDRVALEGSAAGPSESPQPTLSKLPSPKPIQPIVPKVSPPKPSETPVASVLAPKVTPKVRLSLDNTKIAFSSDRYGVLEITVVNIDGTKPRRMTGTLDRQPAWSPGGKRIVFVSVRDGNREIYVMNADGTRPTRLTKTAAGEFDPAWSPNGREIAFASERDGNREIYVMNADGSNPRRLTSTAAKEFEPSWSPDGKRIVFVSARDGNREIYVMNANGSNPRRLTNTGEEEFSPSWSPGGKKIAFASERRGNREIYVMDSDGSNVAPLTSNPAYDGHPSWSPDGAKIAFESYREHNYDIYVMNADGSNPTRLTKTPWDDESPAWSPFLK